MDWEPGGKGGKHSQASTGKRKNPIGKNGKVMRCRQCNSDEHFEKDCPKAEALETKTQDGAAGAANEAKIAGVRVLSAGGNAGGSNGANKCNFYIPSGYEAFEAKEQVKVSGGKARPTPRARATVDTACQRGVAGREWLRPHWEASRAIWIRENWSDLQKDETLREWCSQ